MAHRLTRNAKSGRDWTIYDLAAFDISVVRQDTATFFGQATLPYLPHHPDLLNNLTADEMANEESYHLVRYMDLAMNLVPGEESAVDDFGMQLLRVMGYAGRAMGRDLRSHKDIPLLICGEWRHDKADVCIMDTDGYLCLVQQDYRHLELTDPTPRLIAAAIAAAQYNNQIRDLVGVDAINLQVMAGITMIGTSPTFYKIPVTLDLIESVQRGQYNTRTVVALHRPEVPRPTRRIHEGMRPLDNRRCILSCFEAFKQFTV